MTTRINQALVDRAHLEMAPGHQLYDSEVPGLRLRVGKRGSTFRLVATVNDGTNRPVSITVRRADALTLHQARQEARAQKLRLSRGEDPREERRWPQVPTVAEALELYLASRPDLSPRTVDWYRTMARVPLRGLAARRMDELSRDDCRRVHERVTRDRGPYMANGCMRVLKALHNDVARTHDLPPNPVTRDVRMNRERPRDAAVLPADMPAMWRALDALEDPVRRTAWLASVLTGLRLGDVRTMRWDRIDAEGVLTVPEPKGGAERSFRLPLPCHLLDELEGIRPLAAALPGDWCFPAAGSRSGHLEALRRSPRFDYHPHQFRHGVRSYALAAGVDEAVTRLILNHKDASVTGRYLTREVALSAMRDGVERIAAHLLSFRGA